MIKSLVFGCLSIFSSFFYPLVKRSNLSNINLINSSLISKNELNVKGKRKSILSKSNIKLSPERIVKYDSDRLEILSESLTIDALAQETAGYDYDYPIQDEYNKIMEKFCNDNSISPPPSCQPLISIRFDSVEELESRLIDGKFMADFTILFSNSLSDRNGPLFINLYSFVIKSILAIRKKYPNIYGQDQEKWEKISNSIKSLGSTIKSHYLNSFIEILKWDPIYPNRFAANLFKFECLGIWQDDLKPKLEKLLEDFYSKKKRSCLEILSKHFNGGKEIELKGGQPFGNLKNYLNRDPLLAFLWDEQDYKSCRKCCNISKTLDSLYSNTEEEMENFQLKKNQILTISFKIFPLSDPESDLKFILENNQKIYFESLDSEKKDFSKILNILEDIDQLTTWKNLLNVFDFGEIAETLKHLKLKNLFKKEIDLLGTEISPIYINLLISSDEYEKELEEMIKLKSNASSEQIHLTFLFC